MPLQSYPVPNLINGVSQQAKTQRRDTQAEAQVNCLNDPVDGCLGRPGSQHVAFYAGEDFSDSHSFDIYRSDTEKYRVFILDGDLRVFNLLTGDECTVSFPSGKAYLALPGSAAGLARTSFKARTLEDTTFIANATVTTAIDTSVRSDARTYECMFYVKQAGYGETFSITVSGNDYWVVTPSSDTTDAENYVKTQNVAQAIYTLLTGGTPSSPYGSGTGADLTGLGYTVTVDGNIVYVSRATDFAVWTADGASDQNLISIKGQVTRLSDLPIRGVDGFVVKVKGDSSTTDDDYYLKYTSNAGIQSPGWEECPAADIPLALDADTMPHLLVNDAADTFTFGPATWAQRVSGDGVNTSPDPGFIGRGIRDIFFDKGRLGLMTEAGAAWSKTKQYYTFWPDSAQAALDTDPVDVNIVGTKAAILSHAVKFNEQMFFWADEVQFVRADTETLTQATVDVPETTKFSFNSKVAPVGAGSFLYFANTENRFTSLWEYFVVPQGTSKDASATTDHVPKYIRGIAEHLIVSPNGKILAVATDDAPNVLYVYNQYRASDNSEKLQSAWSRWDFPEGHTIIGGSFSSSDLYLSIQREDGVGIEKIDTTSGQADPGATYVTRLDRRLDESQVSMTYSAVDDETTIVLPFEIAEDETYTVVSREFDEYEFGEDAPPGVLAEIVSASGDGIVVQGDWSTTHLYIGVVPVASREFSTFHPKDEQGAILADRIQVYRLIVSLSNTGYTRAEVSYTNGPTRTTEFTGRILGSPANRFDEVVLDDINLDIGVNAKNTECTITLINDTFLPSAWQSADWRYRMTKRASGRGQGQS